MFVLPPVALHICSESRQKALSIYQPFFTFNELRPIYFPPAHDILDFAEGNALTEEESIYGLPEIKEIQSIGLHYDPHCHYLTESSDLCPFQNPTELILVVRYFDEPVFEFRCCGRTTFFDLDAESTLGPELLRRWEALKHTEVSLRKLCGSSAQKDCTYRENCEDSSNSSKAMLCQP
jgi:hypothetical protein